MTEVFRCVAGSRLFGTANADSDTDYKALFLPTPTEVLLGKAVFSNQASTGAKDAANGPDDVETTVFSLQEYVTLLTKMETNAIEMMFAPALPTDFPLDVVGMLREDRFKVLSANKKCFTGFGKAQANRYSVRGERKTSMEKLCAMLESKQPNEVLRETNIPETLRLTDCVPGVEIIAKPQPGGVMLDFISAFGREMPVTCKVSEALKVYQKPLAEMGKRTSAAAANGGVDWKGLYHAQRVVDEGVELFLRGELVFPCFNAEYYRAVRSGDVPLETVLDQFEDRLLELEELTPISDFREEADMEWANEFVSAIHEQIVVGNYEKWKAAA